MTTTRPVHERVRARFLREVSKAFASMNDDENTQMFADTTRVEVACTVNDRSLAELRVIFHVDKLMAIYGHPHTAASYMLMCALVYRKSLDRFGGQ